MHRKRSYDRDVVGSDTIINTLASHAPKIPRGKKVTPEWR